MLKTIPQSNIETRAFQTFKSWTSTVENGSVTQGFDMSITFGERITGSLFDPETDPKSNDQYKRIVFDTVKQQFYTYEGHSSILTEIGRRKSYASTDERNLEDELALISIPQEVYGEGIKPGSMELYDSDADITYTDDTYSNLVYDGEVYGNIFYNQGVIVLTKDVEEGVSLQNFTLDFQSTKTIHENEILVSVDENEFNISQNHTAVEWDNDIGYVLDEFEDYEESGSNDPTGSYLTPYITTIGIYDDENNLVVVGKLPQPIKNLPDYPINFIVRFDT